MHRFLCRQPEILSLFPEVVVGRTGMITRVFPIDDLILVRVLRATMENPF